jgi:hypothetical protein
MFDSIHKLHPLFKERKILGEVDTRRMGPYAGAHDESGYSPHTLSTY